MVPWDQPRRGGVVRAALGAQTGSPVAGPPERTGPWEQHRARGGTAAAHDELRPLAPAARVATAQRCSTGAGCAGVDHCRRRASSRMAPAAPDGCRIRAVTCMHRRGQHPGARAGGVALNCVDAAAGHPHRRERRRRRSHRRGAACARGDVAEGVGPCPRRVESGVGNSNLGNSRCDDSEGL